jgi:preprotein translocase subunit SecG
MAAQLARGSTDSNGPSFPSESEAAMSSLINIRDRVVRDSLNRTALVVVVVVAIIVVIGVCVYSSYDGDKSSAVKNESPQAELNQ